MNAWNREQRHGKAFRRKNGDVVLHMNINIRHGLTIGNLRVWLDWWRLGLRGSAALWRPAVKPLFRMDAIKW